MDWRDLGTRRLNLMKTYQFVVGSKKIVIMPVCRRFLALSIWSRQNSNTITMPAWRVRGEKIYHDKQNLEKTLRKEETPARRLTSKVIPQSTRCWGNSKNLSGIQYLLWKQLWTPTISTWWVDVHRRREHKECERMKMAFCAK